MGKTVKAIHRIGSAKVLIAQHVVLDASVRVVHSRDGEARTGIGHCMGPGGTRHSCHQWTPEKHNHVAATAHDAAGSLVIVIGGVVVNHSELDGSILLATLLKSEAAGW
eukprot:1897956-Amphidinium_carterae.1